MKTTNLTSTNMNPNNINKDLITISLSTTKTLILLLIIWVLLQTSNYIITVLVLLFIAFILASLMRQTANWLQTITKHKIPYNLMLFFVFILYLFLFWGGLIILFNQIIIQSLNLISQIFTEQNIQEYFIDPLRKFMPFLVNANIGATITSMISPIFSLQAPLAGAKGIVTLLPYLILIFLTAWYIARDLDKFINYLTNIFEHSQKQHLIRNLIIQVDQKVGNWAKAQLLLMLIIGVLTFIFLSIIQLPYALLLAVIAGVLEIIPNLGPTLAAIPAILVGLTTGGTTTALIVIAIYFLIQQFENNLIVPYIMGSVAETHPLITILLIMLGQSLLGPTGAVLSIPLFITIVTIIKTYYQSDKIKHAVFNSKTRTNS